MSNDQEALGALNLYSAKPHAYDSDSVDLALVFASHAATAISNAELVTGLQTALQSRHLIGVAQGILMAQYDMGLETAFEVLRRYSSHANVKLRDVALRVVELRSLPEDYADLEVASGRTRSPRPRTSPLSRVRLPSRAPERPAGAYARPVKPFLLLGTRDDDGAADNEYAAFLEFTRLDESTLRRVRLERGPLGTGRPLRVVGDPPGWRAVQLQRPGRAEVPGPAPRRGGPSPAARRRRRAGLPVPGRLLRHRHARHAPGRGRGPDLRRARRRRRLSASPPEGRADPLTGALPHAFEAFTGHKEAIRSPPAARGDAGLDEHLPGARLPGRPQRLRHPVPPRARRRRAVPAHRGLQALGLLRARTRPTTSRRWRARAASRRRRCCSSASWSCTPATGP